MKKILSILGNTCFIVSSLTTVSCGSTDILSQGGGITIKPDLVPEPDNPVENTIESNLKNYKDHAKNIVFDQDTRNTWTSDDSGNGNAEIMYVQLESDIYNEYSKLLYSLFQIIEINDKDVSTDVELKTAIAEVKKVNNDYFENGDIPGEKKQNVKNLGGLVNYFEVETSFANYLTSLHSANNENLNRLVKLLLSDNSDISLSGQGAVYYYNKQIPVMNRINKLNSTFKAEDFEKIKKQQEEIIKVLNDWLVYHK